MALPLLTVFFLGLAFFSALPLLHSYIVYPFIHWMLAKNRQEQPQPQIPTEKHLPRVSVLMAAYNEEKVLPDKLDNFKALDYPSAKLSFFIGSDASTDRTWKLLQEAQSEIPAMYCFQMEGRTGKPGIINFLAGRAQAEWGMSDKHLFVITDASILLDPDVLVRLVVNFEDPKVAVVDTVLVPVGTENKGVSRSEQVYLSGESLLKYREGKNWGCTVGPFGGCYAIRSDFFHPVPKNFLVDDFFIAMKAMEKGGESISDLGAIVREPATHELTEEFRRKVRISTGNFQNLFYFRHLWWPINTRLAFAFFSHKILRWIGPFFMLVFLIGCLGIVCSTDGFLRWIFGAILILIILFPVLDWLLQKIGVNLFPLRSVRYFIWMNLALGIGAFKFLKGVESNVWQPTKRSGNPLSS